MLIVSCLFLLVPGLIVLRQVLSVVAAKSEMFLVPQLWLLVFIAAALHAVLLLGSGRAVWLIGSVLLITFSAEVAGTRTGIPFGSYHYGSDFGPQVLRVPLIIPMAWFAMIYGAWQTSIRFLRADHRHWDGWLIWQMISLTACLMVLWDLVMDPNQAAAGGWTWSGRGGWFGVPVRNFAGWFVTAAAALLPYLLFTSRTPVRNTDSRVFTFLPILLYFLITALAAVKSAVAGRIIPAVVAGVPMLLLAAAVLGDLFSRRRKLLPG